MTQEEGRDAESVRGAERRLLGLAATLEQGSEHHLARAVLEAAAARGVEPGRVEDFRAIPGEGVVGQVRWSATAPASEGGPARAHAAPENPHDDVHAWVGNEAMAERMGVRPDPALRGWIAEEASRGRSVVFVGTDRDVLGALAFGDRLKPNAAATVRHLKYEGIRWITTLSGRRDVGGWRKAASPWQGVCQNSPPSIVLGTKAKDRRVVWVILPLGLAAGCAQLPGHPEAFDETLARFGGRST